MSGPAAVRSYLYVPADNADRLNTSLGRGADAVIADLEDGVGPADKAVARTNLAAWLASAGSGARDRLGRSVGCAPIRMRWTPTSRPQSRRH